MMGKPFRIWILTVMLLLTCNLLLKGQCIVTNRTPIQDNDTTQVSILVQGLTESDLASDLQGLCAVRIQFKHQVLGDISATLFSPAGDSVVLIAEAVPASPVTDFTRWNVTFVACEFEASPDPGFSDVWSNDQDWGVFGNYTGQYYPFSGCLEDFSTGSANGTWTLRFTDIALFDTGEISGIQLIFCDMEGQVCKACLLDPGITVMDTISICKTATGFKAPISSYNQYQRDTAFFHYKWAIFSDSVLTKINEEGQWSGEDEGLFRVCGFQYAKGDSLKLPDVPIAGNSISLNKIFQDSLLCAKISDTCFYVRVTDLPPDTLDITRYLCGNQPVIFNDSSYTEPGNYMITISRDGCDSIFRLQVLPSELDISIALDSTFYPSDTLSCQKHAARLYAKISGQTQPVQRVSWYTFDGFIQSSQDLDNIILRTRGTYYAVVQDGNCRDTASYYIYEHADNPDIMSEGTFLLNCDTETAVVSVSASLQTDSVKWFSYYTFDTLGYQLVTSDPGVFLAEVYFNNGCVGAKRIDIDTSYTIPSFLLKGDTLQCGKDTATLQLLDISQDSVRIFWTDVVTGTEESVVAQVTQSGWKFVEIIHLISSCSVVDSFFVDDVREFPHIEIQADTLNCILKEVVPEVIASEDSLDFEWTGPGLSFSGEDVVITQGGAYSVQITNSLGCSVIQTFDIFQDTTKPLIILDRVGLLDCDTKEVILQVQEIDPTIQYTWTDNYLPNPVIVNDPGNYLVRAYSIINGCRDSLIAQVFQNESFAKYDVLVTPMNCNRDSALIEIVPRDAFDQIAWSETNPVVFSSATLTASTSTEGTYYFTVISDGDCIIRDSLILTRDTLRPLPVSVTISDINCYTDTGFVKIEWVENPVIAEWLGQNIVYQDVEGTATRSSGIIELSAVGSNGCRFDTTFTIALDTLRPEFEIYYDSLNCFNPIGIATIALESDIDNARWILPDGTELDGWDMVYQETGLYKVIVTGINGCITDKSFEIKGDFSLPDFSVEDSYSLGCKEISIPVGISTATEVYEVKWSSSKGTTWVQNTVDISEEGMYSVVVTGLNGCIDSSSFIVDKITDTVVFQVFADTLTCIRKQIQLRTQTSDAQALVEWRTSNGTLISGNNINVTDGGVYTLFVRPMKLCPDSLNFEVVQDTVAPKFAINQNGDLVCGKTISQLEIKPENTGQVYAAIWTTSNGNILSSSSATVVSIQGEGMYVIRVEDKRNGCITQDSIDVRQLGDNLTKADILVGQPLCKNAELGKISLSLLDGTAPYTITINGKDAGRQTEFSGLQPGSYKFVIRDSLGCMLDTVVQLFAAPVLSLGLEESYKVQFGDTLFWLPDFSDFNGWNFSLTLLERGQPVCKDTCSLPLKISPSRNTIYEIVVTPSNSACSYRQRILVTVDESIFSGIPNIISFSAMQTNNDVFYIPQKRGIKRIKSLRIFDKWGSPVFFREDFPSGEPQFGWNGTINGKNAETGVYLIIVDFELTDGRLLRYNGDVTLIP